MFDPISNNSIETEYVVDVLTALGQMSHPKTTDHPPGWWMMKSAERDRLIREGWKLVREMRDE